MKTTNSWTRLLGKVIAGTFLFALANVAVYHACEYFHMEQDYDATVQGALQKRDISVVLVGDSHTATLKNSYLADSVYNLAFGGDGPREIYAKLRRLLATTNSVKSVVLSADIHMFAEARQASSNRSFADWYLLETGSPYGLEHGRLSALLNAVPLFNDDFVQYLKKSVSSYRRKGGAESHSTGNSSWAALNERDRIEIARRAGELDHRGAGQQPQAVAWYRHIVDLAREHGVRVITVRYPAHPAYFEGIEESTVRRIDSDLAMLGLPPALDYRRAFSDPAVFADEDHLNDSGAVALLHRLEQDTGVTLRNQMLAGHSELAGL